MASQPHPQTVAEAMRLPDLDASDARILLAHVLGVSHAHLVAHGEQRLGDNLRRQFLALAERRRCGEPIAYLVGTREFYGRTFRIGPAVLIPRPETELLVEAALACAGRQVRVLDLGTGSGNVAVTIALERPDVHVVAVDASEAALAVARDNAVALGARNVEFAAGDWFVPLAGRRFDVIASNPPYVAAADIHLEQGDLRSEPALALHAGGDGLACIRHIVAHAARYLNPGGWLLFEHGYDQGAACRALLRAAGYQEVRTEQDLADLPRVAIGRKERCA